MAPVDPGNPLSPLPPGAPGDPDGGEGRKMFMSTVESLCIEEKNKYACKHTRTLLKINAPLMSKCEGLKNFCLPGNSISIISSSQEQTFDFVHMEKKNLIKHFPGWPLSQTAFKNTFIWNLEKPESEGVNVSGGNLLWCYQGIRPVLEVPGVLGCHWYRQSSSHRCRPSHLKQQQVTEVSFFCVVFILTLINLFSFFVILQNFIKKTLFFSFL